MHQLLELQQQIRFALSQLGARNAHHDFEHLCRRIAKLRICSNILPATGPVSAGGDQGRDFETFRSYLAESKFTVSTFVGLVSEGPLAFGCTIQREKLNQKIREDIKAIMSSGSPLEGIHLFLAEDYAVAKRHDIQKWAKAKYSVEVHIYDGAAIAEMLTDRDLFFLAVEFLRLPSESYPTLEHQDNPAWYYELRSRLAKDANPPLNYATFYDLKRALRHATHDKESHQDLSLWLRLLAYFEEPSVFPDLRRRACYEISIAHLLGQGDMTGRGPQLAWYFESIQVLREPSELEDATNLLNYCLGAVARHLVDLTDGDVLKWQVQLAKRLDDLLDGSPTATEKCHYLELRGHVALLLTEEGVRPEAPNIDGVFKYWSRLPGAAKHALLYPIERLADRLTHFIGIVGDDLRLQQLTEKVDALVAKRSGLIIAGEKVRDRCVALHDKGQRVRAIDELHRVKLSWFAEESLDGCCLALLLLCEWYTELGMTFAGKYHALAAAYIGVHNPEESLRRFMLRGLSAAAESAYHQGFWFDFITLAEIAMASASAVPSSRAGKSVEETFQHTVFNATLIRTFAARLDKTIDERVESRLGEWGMQEWFDSLLPEAKAMWATTTDQDLWQRFSEFAGRPFGDLGETRTVEWKQLGIAWTVRWKNDYATTVRAEQFLSVFQILLCKAARRDLGLLEAAVQIEFTVADTHSPRIIPLDSNDIRNWRVVWPTGILLNSAATAGSAMEESLEIALTVLLDVSMLPDASFSEAAKRLFKEGLSSAIYAGKPYETLYRAFVPKEVFDKTDYTSLQPPRMDVPFVSQECRELGTFEGPGPGYSKKSGLQHASNRYSRIPPLIRYTLGRLNADATFRETVKRLRTDGWLDWHLLLAIFNASVNYRARQVADARWPNTAEWERAIARFMKSPEEEDWAPVPFSVFSYESLKMALQMTLPSTVRNEGLQIRHRTPLLDSIFRFLGKRYGYWTDDVPHEPIFAE